MSIAHAEPSRRFALPGNIPVWDKFWPHLKQQCRENALLIIVCALTFIGMVLTANALGEETQRSFGKYIQRALLSISPMLLLFYVITRLFQLCFYEKPDYILATLGKDTWNVVSNPVRWARMIPLLLITSFGFIGFISFKVFIPQIVPFYADETFVQIERALHFGSLPTDWIAPLMASDLFVNVLDFGYKLWYFVMFYLWGWAAWGASDKGWRRQFVLSFMLCWIIGGIVMAIMLSSVGPCFYGAFIPGENPYAEHMARLYAAHAENNLIAVNIQTFMVEIWFDESYSGAIGISAMPSLHNTLAVLFAICGYAINKWLGRALTAYAILIFVGSVALGWHYAIDGYVGAAVAFAMWKLAAVLLRWQDRQLDIAPDEPVPAPA